MQLNFRPQSSSVIKRPKHYVRDRWQIQWLPLTSVSAVHIVADTMIASHICVCSSHRGRYNDCLSHLCLRFTSWQIQWLPLTSVSAVHMWQIQWLPLTSVSAVHIVADTMIASHICVCGSHRGRYNDCLSHLCLQFTSWQIQWLPLTSVSAVHIVADTMIASHICVCGSHQLQLVRIHLVRTGHKLAHTWPTSFLLSIEKRKTHDNMWISFFPHWVFVTPDKNNKTWSHDCYFCETLAPQHVRAPTQCISRTGCKQTTCQRQQL